MLMRMCVVLVCLAGAAQAAKLGDHLGADNAVLLKWVQGSFNNKQQVSAGTNALAEAGLVEGAAPDLLYPVFKRIEIPAFDGDVIYLQWPMGTPDGKLQRQRIWVFRADSARNAIMMKFYTLKEP